MGSLFRGIDAGDVTYICSGADACKSTTTLNCGAGNCVIDCSGQASCDANTINDNGAASLLCSGADANCPPIRPPPPPVPAPTIPPVPTMPPVPCAQYPPCECQHLQCFAQRDPLEGCECLCPDRILHMEWQNHPDICGVGSMQVYDRGACACGCPANAVPINGCPAGQEFRQNTCQCECPGGNECPGRAIMDIGTCQCRCPSATPTAADCGALGRVLRNCGCECPNTCGHGQIQDPDTCGCGCPFGSPTAADCVSGVIDPIACQCAAPIPSKYCCRTSVPNFEPWFGRCWDEISEADCLAEPNTRCEWRPNDCLGSPPRNPEKPNSACAFRDEACVDNADCCSNVCRVDNTCR